MRPIRDMSIKTKLFLLSGTSVAIALLLSYAVFTVYEVNTLRSFKVQSLRMQAGTLAFNSTGVLAIQEAAAARKLLESLQLQPTVEFACLLENDGRVLATYPKNADAASAPRTIASDTCRFTASGHLELFQAVEDRGEKLGTLYIRANVEDINRQLLGYGQMLLVAAMLAFGATLLIASRLQRTIAKPLQELAQTAMRAASANDYTIRVEHCSLGAHDELGTLCHEFNHMLERVETSDSALKKAHDELEDRVVERTAELQQEIARREKTQAELVDAKNAAEAANVAKSRFLANMSHEIRTPLNAIMGFTDLLRRADDQDSEADREDYLQTIYTSGQHLLGLINDILDLSKVEAERLDVESIACSPHEIINEIVSVLRVRALEKGLTLDYRWVGKVPETISTDPARLRQLMMNLVSNAIKFTSAGGVHIIVELVSPETDPHLSIEVVDSGIGIPADKLDDIFNPFVQADSSVTRKFGGTGLGLTISRRIAEALGGTIRVSSTVGEGSSFVVTLPTGPLTDVRILDAPLSDGIRQTKQKHERAPLTLPHARALLVEDGDTNRKLISLVLRRAGLEVTTAENGLIGLDLAIERGFDVVLMDMQMPVMDGYTAASRMRDHGLTMPIIALTAHAMKGDEEKCLAAGCSDYVTKPVDADLLIAMVAKVLVAADAPPASVAETDCEEAAPGAIVSTLPADDAEFREIVDEFVVRLGAQLAAMREALTARRKEELMGLAHWLKGLGGTAGFPAFTEPAKTLERLVKTEKWDAAEDALSTILKLASRIVVAQPTTDSTSK